MKGVPHVPQPPINRTSYGLFETFYCEEHEKEKAGTVSTSTKARLVTSAVRNHVCNEQGTSATSNNIDPGQTERHIASIISHQFKKEDSFTGKICEFSDE